MILLVLGIAVARIGNGLRKNNQILYEVGNAIGDVHIPKQQSNRESVSFWIAVAMMLAGAVCLCLSIHAAVAR